MTNATKVQVSTVAHTKIVLHAAANPDCQVLHGILVGYAENQSLNIVDVLPVCHSHPTKTILNVSFRIADEYLKRGQQQTSINSGVVGWYTAKERRDDTLEPHPTSLRIMSTIHSSTSTTGDNNCALLCVPNDFSSSYQAYSWDGTQRMPVTVDDPKATATAAIGKSCNGSSILTSSHIPIYDFENHLEGAQTSGALQERDWLANPAVIDFVMRVT